MAKVKSIEIKCSHCGTWFPSPIGFGDMSSFDSSTLIGNKVQCQNCQKMVSCNKENMRIRSEDGGFTGIDTI